MTTHSEGGEGFELYIDGEMAGETVEGRSYVGALPHPLSTAQVRHHQTRWVSFFALS